jgi:hypothetical protein
VASLCVTKSIPVLRITGANEIKKVKVKDVGEILEEIGLIFSAGMSTFSGFTQM